MPIQCAEINYYLLLSIANDSGIHFKKAIRNVLPLNTILMTQEEDNDCARKTCNEWYPEDAMKLFLISVIKLKSRKLFSKIV